MGKKTPRVIVVNSSSAQKRRIVATEIENERLRVDNERMKAKIAQFIGEENEGPDLLPGLKRAREILGVNLTSKENSDIRYEWGWVVAVTHLGKAIDDEIDKQEK